jgi:hypothetical protein
MFLARVDYAAAAHWLKIFWTTPRVFFSTESNWLNIYDGVMSQDKKKRNPLQFLLPSREPVPDSSPPKLLFRASVTWLTHPLPVPP